MRETWKDAIGYEGLYEVSNTGKVRRFNNKKILKQRTNKNGYYRIQLSKKSKLKNHGVSRLVAQAFIPNPNNLPQVNHKNGLKFDNNINNLEWVSIKDNIIHSFVTGLNKTSKTVICIETKEEFYSCCEASRCKGIDNSLISKVCRGERKTAGGFHWQYK